MRIQSIAVTGLCLLTNLVAAIPLRGRADKPVAPTDDDFYTPPDGYENKELGAILKHRTVGNPGFLFLEARVEEVIQIMYRSSNSSGSPMATVTTVLKPKNADSSKVLSYQIYEDSSYLNCAPSYGIQYQSDPGALVAQIEFLTMASALDQGWIVNTPDYEGPNASFTAGILSGHATLDSIRAVLDSKNITGVEPNATVTMWGYSGGSLASGWAAELQPKYAPELKLAGAALGGLVPNISDVALRVNKGPFAGLVPAAFNGLAQEYPEIQELIDRELIEEKADDYNQVKEQCLIEYVLPFAFKDWGTYCKSGVDVLRDPAAQKVIEENTMGKDAPKIPLFLYHGQNDEVTAIENVDTVYDSWCSKKDATIEFVRDKSAEHIIETLSGAADAFNWLKDRMNGKGPKPGCNSRDTFSTLIDDGAIETFGEEIGSALRALIGHEVGPKDAAI